MRLTHVVLPATAIQYALMGHGFIIEDMKGPDGKTYRGCASRSEWRIQDRAQCRVSCEEERTPSFAATRRMSITTSSLKTTNRRPRGYLIFLCG